MSRKKAPEPRDSRPRPGQHPLGLLTGYQWWLKLSVGWTTLTLDLLRAQLEAFSGVHSAPLGARLNIRDIYDCVSAAGYHEISEIEWEDGCYEVEALDAEGQPVELQVCGNTGRIERVEARD